MKPMITWKRTSLSTVSKKSKNELIMLAKLGCRVFFEFVASDDNPSDGLSRNGLLDNWSLEQNWSLDTAKQPNIAWCLKADFHDLHDWLASEFA